jgi:hypothetical protein
MPLYFFVLLLSLPALGPFSLDLGIDKSISFTGWCTFITCSILLQTALIMSWKLEDVPHELPSNVAPA